MLFEVVIRTKDDASEYSIDTIEDCQRVAFLSSESTYHDAKREDVGWFVELALEMCLWTAPIVIPSQHSFNASAWRKVGCVLKVSDLNLSDNRLLADAVVVDHHIVWFDV